MERKDIEKASFKFGLENQVAPGLGGELRIGFVAGAEWRINSVWHDKSEIPQIYGEYKNDLYPQIPCLVLGHLSTGYGYGVRYWNVTHQVWDDEECDDFECKMDAIEKWTYLDDLLPTNEEDEK